MLDAAPRSALARRIAFTALLAVVLAACSREQEERFLKILLVIALIGAAEPHRLAHGSRHEHRPHAPRHAKARVGRHVVRPRRPRRAVVDQRPHAHPRQFDPARHIRVRRRTRLGGAKNVREVQRREAIQREQQQPAAMKAMAPPPRSRPPIEGLAEATPSAPAPRRAQNTLRGWALFLNRPSGLRCIARGGRASAANLGFDALRCPKCDAQGCARSRPGDRGQTPSRRQAASCPLRQLTSSHDHDVVVPSRKAARTHRTRAQERVGCRTPTTLLWRVHRISFRTLRCLRDPRRAPLPSGDLAKILDGLG